MRKVTLTLTEEQCDDIVIESLKKSRRMVESLETRENEILSALTKVLQFYGVK